MANPYIQLNIDPQYINKQFVLKVFKENTPVIRCYFYLNNIPFSPPGDYDAFLSYADTEIEHSYTEIEGTISGNYCDFTITDDFFTDEGDFYTQIYIKSDSKQIVFAHGTTRVLNSLFD